MSALHALKTAHGTAATADDAVATQAVGDRPPPPAQRELLARACAAPDATTTCLVDAQDVLATEHGDPLATNRVIVHAEQAQARTGALSVGVLGGFVRQARPRPCQGRRGSLRRRGPSRLSPG